eukprot:3675165-Amphidinium_carterae.1
MATYYVLATTTAVTCRGLFHNTLCFPVVRTGGDGNHKLTFKKKLESSSPCMERNLVARRETAAKTLAETLADVSATADINSFEEAEGHVASR